MTFVRKLTKVNLLTPKKIQEKAPLQKSANIQSIDTKKELSKGRYN